MRPPNLFPRRDLTLSLSFRGEPVAFRGEAEPVCETAKLNVTRLILGRAGADWVLPPADAQVSHRHAELFLRRGRWHIRDLGSRNGVWLLGERVEGERPLAPGDVYLLGECRLTVALPGRRAADAASLPAHHMLQRLGGRRAGERLPLAAFPVTVGTDEGCALRLGDALASRRHAELFEQATEEGGAPGVFLRDLGSTNGTTVNGVPQKPEMNARLLSEGDVLAFASETFRFLDRAVPHDDPKAGLRKGVAVGGLFALVVAAFAVVRLFVWKDAPTRLAEAEALGQACRFAEASEALEKARHARGAEAVAEALEACAGRLGAWGRQAGAWQAYRAAWAAAAPGEVPRVSAAVPRADPEAWPNALRPARAATLELERLATADGTLRRLLAQQTPLSEADLATLRALPETRVDVAALERVGLTQGAAWREAFLAAPEAEARRLLPAWQGQRARAKALLDATEGVEGAFAFIERQAPDSEAARKLRSVAASVAEAEALRGELLGKGTPEARLTAFLLFPETCDAAARAAFRAVP